MGYALPLIIVCLSLCCSVATSVDESANLEDFLEQQIQNFKVDFHRTLESERIRRKRDIGQLLGMAESGGVSPERLRFPPEPSGIADLAEFRVSCWTWTLVDPILFPASHLLLVVTQDGRFVLMGFNGEKFNVLHELEVQDNAYKAQVFSVGRFVWLTVAYQGMSGHWFQMYRYDGTTVLLKQTIPLVGQADIAVVYNRGDWYMTVATTDQLVLYEWRQTQMDAVAWAALTGVRSLAVWSSGGAIYVAAAVSQGEAVGSPLFVYTRRSGKLSRIQILPKLAATKVIHFVVQGNDYLLFVCQHAAVI